MSVRVRSVSFDRTKYPAAGREGMMSRSHGWLMTSPGSAACAAGLDSASDQSASAKSAGLLACPAARERGEGGGVFVGLRHRFIVEPYRVHDHEHSRHAHHRGGNPDYKPPELLIVERAD